MIPGTVIELVDAYRRRQLSPVEVVGHYLERIERLDPDLRSFLYVSDETARAAARWAESAWRLPDCAPPLAGVPLAHKDILHTVDAPTTGNSKLLESRESRRDAEVVALLRAAGAVSLGKTNLSEFACGSMDRRGMPANPWRTGIYAGGSSGGSASAVAGGLAPAATGTDTAGSIRVPASFCGLVGVKPTFGLVSNEGVVPLSWTMDTVGPMTVSVRDAAILLSVMAHPAAEGSRGAAAHRAHIVPAEASDVRRLRVGLPTQHFFDGLEPAVDRAVKLAVAALQAQGAELVDVDLPLAGELAACGSVLVMSEGYAVHADTLRSHPASYGNRTRRRLVAGGAYTVADLHAAHTIAEAWRNQLTKVLDEIDVLVVPTLPHTAFSFERQLNDPPDTSWGTRHFNLAGTPALTLPCGLDDNGLPIGVQVAAKRFDEATMFRAAQAIELAIEFGKHRPKEVTP